MANSEDSIARSRLDIQTDLPAGYDIHGSVITLTPGGTESPSDQGLGVRAYTIDTYKQQGPWQGQNFQVDLDWCIKQFRIKITSIDWTVTKEDVRRFVKTTELPSVNLWGKDLFLAQLEKMK